MFFPNYTANLIISVVGVIIFVGLVAYDTQKIKQLSYAVANGDISEEEGKKTAVIGALELYLDFINLFIYILRLFGNRK
jgi:FtsH-binding integral membrane protein